MGTKNYTYTIKFDAKTGEFVTAMKKSAIASKSVTKNIGLAQKVSNKAISSFKAMGSTLLAAFAVSSIINFVKKSEAAYDVQSKAEQGLLVALKGKRDVQKDLIAQAQTLQKTTLFGDEETIKADALIAAFVKEGDQIKKVIPLVQDLAAAKNMDLAAAADLVSKTLGSSTNAMARYGIQVNGAVGSVERLESLVTALNDAFGGQAAAAAKAGVGAVTQMNNAWGDFLETIGEGGSTTINDYSKFITALINYGNNEMRKGMDANISEDERMHNKIKSSSAQGLLDMKKTYQQQASLYKTMYLDAIAKGQKKGEDNDRAHYSVEYSLARDAISDIEKEIKARKGQGVVATTVSQRIIGLQQELAIAAKNAANTNDVDLFVKGNKDVVALKAQIASLNKYLAANTTTPRDSTSMNTIETKQVTSVGDVSTPDITGLVDMGTILEDNAGKVMTLKDSLSDGWDSYGDGIISLSDNFNQLGGAIGGTAGNYLSFATQMLEMIPLLIAQITALATTEVAQSTSVTAAKGSEAMTKGIAASQSVPFPFNLIALAATMVAIGSALKGVGAFAYGGEVAGNSFSGDKMLIRVNSGEEVLRQDNPRHIRNYRGGVGTQLQSNTSVSFAQSGIQIKGRTLRILLKKEEKASQNLGS